MINKVVIISKYLPYKSLYTFSITNATDPYYILGVEKTAQFAQIKKAFYKLANQYHPDKAIDDKQMHQKFLLIKQAYQAIKMQKGLTKPAGFIYDSDVKSMRPDPSRFQTDDQENRKNNADYRMYQEKAEAGGQQYEQFKGTFKTLNDINDIKIRVEKGQMKDTSKRFKLQDLKASLSNFSGNSAYYYLFIIGAAVSFYMILLRSSNASQANQLESSLEIQDAKLSKRRVFDEEEQKRQKYVETLEKDQDVKKYLQKSASKYAIKGYQQKRDQIASGENSF